MNLYFLTIIIFYHLAHINDAFFLYTYRIAYRIVQRFMCSQRPSLQAKKRKNSAVKPRKQPTRHCRKGVVFTTPQSSLEPDLAMTETRHDDGDIEMLPDSNMKTNGTVGIDDDNLRNISKGENVNPSIVKRKEMGDKEDCTRMDHMGNVDKNTVDLSVGEKKMDGNDVVVDSGESTQMTVDDPSIRAGSGDHGMGPNAGSSGAPTARSPTTDNCDSCGITPEELTARTNPGSAAKSTIVQQSAPKLRTATNATRSSDAGRTNTSKMRRLAGQQVNGVNF